MTKNIIYYDLFKSDDYGSILGGVCNEKIAFLGLTDDPQEMRSHYKSEEFIQDTKKTEPFFKKIFENASLKIVLYFQGTDFQQRVWHALANIPRGTTCSYGKIAQIIGHPKAARAVGSAIGYNPVSLLIPCHRVLCSNGNLGGYRWGSPLKKKILDHEKQSL